MREKDWQYPLLHRLTELYGEGKPMSNVLLIACQHLLGTQYEMVTSLYRLGLKPSNCILIGKNYSANREIVRQLHQDGCKVAPFSESFDPDQPFDTWFGRHVRDYLRKQLWWRGMWPYRKIVVLDDGGLLHEVCNTLPSWYHRAMAGVEQTTSGDTKIKKAGMKYPVRSIARTHYKQYDEAPYIAEHAYERILSHMKTRKKGASKVLVLGLGTIGRNVAGRFWRDGHNVYAADATPGKTLAYGACQLLRNKGCVLSVSDAYSRLKEFDVIVGATGTSLFDESVVPTLHPEVSLVSVSSSDREFPAPYFRRGVAGSVHEDYYCGGRCLVNGGFPITFGGNYHEVAPEHIELTVATLMASVLDAVAPEQQYFQYVIHQLAGMVESGPT
ncbi:MAG TPA: hypothetical protein VGE59_03130 [Patescibacteria group bacterium]